MRTLLIVIALFFLLPSFFIQPCCAQWQSLGTTGIRLPRTIVATPHGVATIGIADIAVSTDYGTTWFEVERQVTRAIMEPPPTYLCDSIIYIEALGEGDFKLVYVKMYPPFKTGSILKKDLTSLFPVPCMYERLDSSHFLDATYLSTFSVTDENDTLYTRLSGIGACDNCPYERYLSFSKDLSTLAPAGDSAYNNYELVKLLGFGDGVFRNKRSNTYAAASIFPHGIASEGPLITDSNRAYIVLWRNIAPFGPDGVQGLIHKGFLYASDDYGNHWRSIQNNLPPLNTEPGGYTHFNPQRGVTLLQVRPNVLVVSCEGTYITYDNGNHWQPFVDGLEYPDMTFAGLVVSGDYIIGIDFAGGAYRYPLSVLPDSR